MYSMCNAQPVSASRIAMGAEYNKAFILKARKPSLYNPTTVVVLQRYCIGDKDGLKKVTGGEVSL